jgi:predicted SnoaL-like aldol condensation-catalyzing enzyme
MIPSRFSRRAQAGDRNAKDGTLVEHWDVIQDEVTEQQSKSGNPMFGDSFPK